MVVEDEGEYEPLQIFQVVCEECGDTDALELCVCRVCHNIYDFELWTDCDSCYERRYLEKWHRENISGTER